MLEIPLTDQGSYAIDEQRYTVPFLESSGWVQLSRDDAREMLSNWRRARVVASAGDGNRGADVADFRLLQPGSRTEYPLVLDQNPFTGEALNTARVVIPTVRVGPDLLIRELEIHASFPPLLYATLLESSGISTAVITTPGHIFVTFDSGMVPADAASLFEQDDSYVHSGTVWIPMETTALSDGFVSAWQTAVLQWQQADKEGSASFFSQDPPGTPTSRPRKPERPPRRHRRRAGEPLSTYHEAIRLNPVLAQRFPLFAGATENGTRASASSDLFRMDWADPQ